MSLQDLFASLERIPEANPFNDGRFVFATDAMRFMLSGRATVTFKGKTNRFTYKITAPKAADGTVDYNADIRFVALMNGPDNEANFQYLGYIKRGVFFYGAKSKIGADAPSAKAFDWSFRKLAKGEMPSGLEVLA